MWSHGPRRRLLRELQMLFNPEDLLTDPADCWAYGYDNSRRQTLPLAVVFPTQSTQVESLVKLCNKHRISLTARGRGTGTTGASVPDPGALVVSFERMDRILEINGNDRLVVVEPGVINSVLQQALSTHGFFWPPDPGSAAICSVGGNLACNAAGPHAVKYGTPRENTLGLHAITGAGAFIRSGGRTTKGVVGYDLTRLLIGSAGTLALITQATLLLTPLPETRRTLRAVYSNINAAAVAVAAIMAQPVTPCALEFMDAAAIELIRHYPGLDLPVAARALLMIEVDGPNACIQAAVAAISSAAQVTGLIDLRSAVDDTEANQLWAARKALSPALRTLAPKKINEDVVVPVSKIPVFIDYLERLGGDQALTIVNFGHAGNGNIHVNILVQSQDAEQLRRATASLSAMFDQVLALGGTLSGEHGVGLEKRDFVACELAPPTLALLRAIKQQFDPQGILNPGKGLPPV